MPGVSALGPGRAVRGERQARVAALVRGPAELAIRVCVVPVASERAQRHVGEAALHRLNIHSIMHTSAETTYELDGWHDW